MAKTPKTSARPAASWRIYGWKLSYWLLGIGSLVWLLLRTGTKPRRATYPCQRIAAANSAGFVAYLAALLGSATLLRRLRVSFSPARLVLLIAGLLLTASLHGSVATPATPLLADSPDLPSWTSPTAVSNVFAITNVPEPQYSLDGGVIPGGVPADEALRDDGVEALIGLMETHGDYFYQTTAHPGGLFGPDDVVVIKINNQWGEDNGERNATSTDVVKGAINKLVQHPAGFTGVVIVAENSQNVSSNVMDGNNNNSQFTDQSYQEVADAFVGQGYHVCTYTWDALRDDIVDDYDADDNNNGYVLMDADDSTEEQGHLRLSYPKFQINCDGIELSISMKQGLWDGASFDDESLKMINMPVLKRHNSAWATIAVKNYLGFITTYNANAVRWAGVSEMHCWLTGPSDNGKSCPDYNASYGLIGRQMARIRRADLNVVDAIWVNADNNLGGGSLRQDVLLASRDPFAVDYYASDYILGPLIHQIHPSHVYTQAMASTRGGWLRNIQKRNVADLRAEGLTDTINMDDSMTVAEELAQFNVYVADASAPAAPTLTLLAPNGGESWGAGTQQQILWSATNLAGDVHLEYSTNDFASASPIADLAADDGTYTWTVPNDPSDSVLVRVSSAITATISDTSDAVFTIASSPAPTLTLLAPNGGERWEVGTQQNIQWSSTNLDQDVCLEYTTDDLASANVITSVTPNDGAYTWTVPNDLSDNVLVRVSSDLGGTSYSIISDTSDAAFTIAGPHTFEDSFKQVSHLNRTHNETVTYTIVLYEDISATLTFSDAIPAPLTYVPGSANIEPDDKGTLLIEDGIYWSGVVTGMQPVTITFQAQTPGTSAVPLVIVNHAQISRNGAAPIERTASFFLGGFQVYLPLVVRNH